MAWKIRPARFNLRFVRAMRKALANGEDCCGLVPETYHLLVSSPEAEQPARYTVCLVHDDEGTYMATCRELPELLVFESSKADVIATAHATIEEALAAQGGLSDVAEPAAAALGNERARSIRRALP